MSIQEQITRITNDKNIIRNKMVEIGVATNTDNLDTLATKIDGIPNNGAVSVEILEGKSYTIPRGWHSGAGVVKAMTDVEGEAEQYKTQSKTVTPTKSQQTVASDEGYYALESVTVAPIPDAYQDVTAVNATADKVLTGSTYVDKDGKVTAGTMPNNGTAGGTLTPANAVHTIHLGYHNGLGTVGVVTEEKTFTPTKEKQTHNATTKFVNKVIINPIPDAYQDVTEVTTTADKVLAGSAFVDAAGTVVDGTMPNNGSYEMLIDTNESSMGIPKGYHDGTGRVYLVTEEKSVTPTKSAQTISPTAGKVLSKVSVAAIPAAYQDVTGVTAEAAHVLDGKFYVTSSGVKTEGTMTNNGAVSASIVGTTSSNNSYTIPKGYHDGTGKVTLTSDIEELLAAI